jgi:hypothetical protein
LTRAGILIVMWVASIVTAAAAAAHTLDVSRYLVPAVPMVGLMLSLFAVELTETIAYLPRGRSTRELSCAENASARSYRGKTSLQAAARDKLSGLSYSGGRSAR